MNNSNLNKIFVYVPSNEVAAFKTGAGLTNAYKSRISFLAGTGEIMTNGETFGINKDEDINALKNLLGTNSNSISTDLGFEASTIIGAIKYVYDLASENNEDVEARLDVIEGTGEGSIKKSVNDAIAALINNAPDALDTLKEIADWISHDGNEAANIITRMDNIEAQVAENEQVTAGALIDLQQQINQMTGGAGSVQSQISANIEALDSSVTLAGTTAAQPQEVGIETSIDVLGSITVAEVDGLLKQDESTKIVLQADAAGAAKKAYDTLYGTDQDTIDAITLKGLKARVDYKTRTGILSVGSAASGQSLNYDASTGDLATVKGVADAINGIEMWETYTAE